MKFVVIILTLSRRVKQINMPLNTSLARSLVQYIDYLLILSLRPIRPLEWKDDLKFFVKYQIF